MEIFLNVLGSIFMIPAVQTAIVIVIVAIISYFARKAKWAKTIALFAATAYEFAEQEGLVQGLKAYEKLDPFMDKLIEQIREEFGREPTPEEIGKAVEVMEGLVAKEPGK